MKKFGISVGFVVIIAVFAFSNAVFAQSHLIDFEEIDVGTMAGDLGDPFISIQGHQMEVVAEALAYGSILAFNSNKYGTNAEGGQNWLRGTDDTDLNRRSLGNSSSVKLLTGQDLIITFNPLIKVTYFRMEMFDYGDWFPLQLYSTNPNILRKAYLTAYDSTDIVLDQDIYEVYYDLINNDASIAGAVPLHVDNLGGIAKVELKFEAVDPGVTFDNFYIEYEPRVSINIKPYSWPNAINTCSKGATPVIIWGSAVFDVTKINLDSLTFGDLGIKVVGKGNKSLFEIGDFGQPDPTFFDGINPEPDGYDDLNAKFDTYQLSTFTEGVQTLGKVCFDYDADGNGGHINICVEQEIYLSRECVE